MRNEIREAAARVPGHWHQGALTAGGVNFGVRLCGIGHLLDVMGVLTQCLAGGLSKPPDSVSEGISERIAERIAAMNVAARDKFPDRITRPAAWAMPFAQFNDDPSTVESEVVAVMELAADRWEIEHG